MLSGKCFQLPQSVSWLHTAPKTPSAKYRYTILHGTELLARCIFYGVQTGAPWKLCAIHVSMNTIIFACVLSRIYPGLQVQATVFRQVDPCARQQSLTFAYTR